LRPIGTFLLLLAFGVCQAQIDLKSGERLYQICAGCHGFAGEGSKPVNAPRLSGIEPWYLERQMRYFQTGVRGQVQGDQHGMRMATMAAAVRGDRALADLLAYVQQLPRPTPAPTVAGDVERGRSLYAICGACHGADGSGNVAQSAPGLVLLDDWYFVEQLRLYAEGLRGTHSQDSYGRQMAALAATFNDAQSRTDLAAYVATLSE
jgi:cytochrome c oxidase subunit 2